MAYGDNRQVAFSDLFPSGIGAAWLNGGAVGWFGFQPVAGGHIEPQHLDTNAAVRRILETFANDQWATATVEAHGATGDWIGVGVRMGADGDGSAYVGYAQTSTNTYQIWKRTAAGSFAEVASVAAGGGELPLVAGESLTVEVEGLLVRLGSNALGSDVEKLTYTDVSGTPINSGRPGLTVFATGAQADARITAITGGNLSSGSTGQGTNNLTLTGPHGALVTTLESLMATSDLDYEGAGSIDITTLDSLSQSDIDRIDLIIQQTVTVESGEHLLRRRRRLGT